VELGNEEIKNRQVICWWSGKMIFSSFLYDHKFYLDFDKDESSNHDAMYLLPNHEKNDYLLAFLMYVVICDRVVYHTVVKVLTCSFCLHFV